MTAPIQIDIRSNLREVQLGLSQLEKRQFPFAFGRALTATAKIALGDLRTKMQSVFDRPTPYTLNAFYVKPAKKNDRSVWIGAREFSTKGTPAFKYLMPETFGGVRQMKRFERALSPFSGGQYVVPGRGASLDAFGNISRGQIVQVLSRLKTMNDTAQNRSDKTTRRLRRKGMVVAATGHEYFVAKSKKGGRPLGVYKLVSKGKVEPIFIFTNKDPSYSTRFPFEATVQKSVQTNFNDQMQKALAYAMATAR